MLQKNQLINNYDMGHHLLVKEKQHLRWIYKCCWKMVNILKLKRLVNFQLYSLCLLYIRVLWSDIMVTGSHSLLRFLSARWINTSNWHQAGIMWLLMYAVTDICNMFLLIVCKPPWLEDDPNIHSTAFLNQSLSH